MGADIILTRNGTETILGDNGFVQMDAAGVNHASIGTYTQPAITDLGGNDVITALDGMKAVLGGDGADTISLGVGSASASDHVVLGDNGSITYVAAGQPGAGAALAYQTTDTVTTTGGSDLITTGNGNNTILAGMGADIVMTGAGTDTILGDNGLVQMDAQGNELALVATTSQPSTGGSLTDLGGGDTITSLAGAKTVLGGDGADAIVLGTGVHDVLGDNGSITYVAMGQTGAGNALTYQTTDTLAATGGNDTVTVADGDNTILAGMGADAISTANGTDVILGDNGFVQMDAEGNNLAQVATFSQASTGGSLTDLGGSDIVTSLAGDKTVLGGDAGDTITLGAGDHAVLGDNGVITYVALGEVGAGNALRYATTDTIASTGGDDTITAGNGDNTVLAGMGADVVTTAAGNDTILGDNGVVQMDAPGRLLQSIDSTQTLQGANDTILAGDGDKNVIGGYADDTITVGTGTHTMLGDNGSLTFDEAGVLRLVMTTEPLIGGHDMIIAAGGDTIVLAGLGDDTVTTGSGADVLLGDNGFVTRDALGRLLQIETTQPQYGGNDALSSGAGDDSLLGGQGADSLLAGAGNDNALGDTGRITYVDGFLRMVETIDPFIGMPDFIDGGGGQNVLIGGDGNDISVGNLSDDVLAGDYASVTFDAAHHVTSLVRFGGGPDLVAESQEALYVYTAPDGAFADVPQVYRGATIRIGGPAGAEGEILGDVYVFDAPENTPLAGLPQVYRGTPIIIRGATMGESRLGDYLILPSLAGFDYVRLGHHHSASTSGQLQSLPPVAVDPQQAPASNPAPAVTDLPLQGGAPESSGPASGGTTAVPREPAANSASPDAVPGEGAEVSVPPGEPVTEIDRGVPDTAALELSDRLSGENARPLEMAMAGLLGTRAWQALQRLPKRALRVSGASLQLERPASSEAKGSAAGSVERAARAWLDGALGMHSSVQTSDYDSRPAAGISIDWQAGSKTGADPEKKDATRRHKRN
jgi:Ca2+-binding RTX toxin-like protein